MTDRQKARQTHICQTEMQCIFNAINNFRKEFESIWPKDFVNYFRNCNIHNKKSNITKLKITLQQNSIGEFLNK